MLEDKPGKSEKKLALENGNSRKMVNFDLMSESIKELERIGDINVDEKNENKIENKIEDKIEDKNESENGHEIENRIENGNVKELGMRLIVLEKINEKKKRKEEEKRIDDKIKEEEEEEERKKEEERIREEREREREEEERREDEEIMLANKPVYHYYHIKGKTTLPVRIVFRKIISQSAKMKIK